MIHNKKLFVVKHFSNPFLLADSYILKMERLFAAYVQQVNPGIIIPETMRYCKQEIPADQAGTEGLLFFSIAIQKGECYTYHKIDGKKQKGCVCNDKT